MTQEGGRVLSLFWELKYVNEGGFQQRQNIQRLRDGIHTDFELISEETFLFTGI